MRLVNIAVTLLIVRTLSGCASVDYGGESFYTADGAKAAPIAERKKIINLVQLPLTAPVGKLGRVILPSKKAVTGYVAATHPRQIWINYKLSFSGCRESWQDSCLEDAASILYEKWRTVAEVIQRRAIFEKLVIEEVDKEEPYVTTFSSIRPGEAVIYLGFKDPIPGGGANGATSVDG